MQQKQNILDISRGVSISYSPTCALFLLQIYLTFDVSVESHWTSNFKYYLKNVLLGTLAHMLHLFSY